MQDPQAHVGAPVCLIHGSHEGLRVADEGLRLLESLNEPIAVVCLAGQYRTGKSFFLNQLTRTRERVENIASAVNDSGNDAIAALNGFRVGPTTESCTRGIWLWDPQPSIRNTRGEKVLFMDTEGIAATDNDESYDAKIFSLGLLLSSLFVFNTMGVIDEGAIDRLFLVSELTKHVCVTADTGHQPPPNASLPQNMSTSDAELDDDTDLKDSMAESRELAPHFPPFIWLLRDFMLDMQQDGTSLSPNEYLEKSLKLREGSSRRNEERNKIRKSIQVLFARRECLTLVRPVMDEMQLRRAAELSVEELRPEFVVQMENIRDRILSIVAPKQLFGKVMDGAKLAHLVKCYTKTMNSGSVPDIRAAWEYVSEATCQSALLNAIELYDAKMAVVNPGGDTADEFISNGDMKILTQPEFEKIHKDAQEEALSLFKNQSVEGATRAACFQKLKVHIQKQKSALIAFLQKRSTALCEQTLVGLRRKYLQQPLEDATLDELEKAYEEQAQGPSKKIVFYNFLRTETIGFFQTLFERLSQGFNTAKAKWERELADLQHEKQTHELTWKQQVQAKEVEIKLLLESKAHAEDKERMQNGRISELQHHTEHQQSVISTLEEKKRSVKGELDDLQAAYAQMEKELEKTKLHLEHKENALQQQVDEARQVKQELTQQLEAARISHQDEKEEWIKRVADQTSEKNGLQKQLKQREHELQQKQLDLELMLKEHEQLRQEYAEEAKIKSQKSTECLQLREQNAELESQLEDTLTFQSSLTDEAEREKARLHARLERYQSQLGRLETDREVEDLLKDCVAEVVRLAEVDKINTLMEEKELLQEQLGEVYLKISTLPDFYQREIFCSPEPTPDFFEVLTS
uniref:GB1/RHD3-type G domain-containing protein n=1 Tax=Globisporangium ultimum (strain ATCC 200006 / CBS 805.95 / DAOM BR144) TaxID=431595 RepID=K3WCC7_GLOUD